MEEGRGYLPWMGKWYCNTVEISLYSILGGGEEVPTLDSGEGVSTLDAKGTYPGQVMPWMVHLLCLPAGGLSCSSYVETKCNFLLENIRFALYNMDFPSEKGT